jgi:hypothetical protein
MTGMLQPNNLEVLTRHVDIKWDSNNINNYSLCWIKSIKKDNKIPFNVGYYFTDYPEKTGKLYYSNSLLGDVVEVCDFPLTHSSPMRQCVIAVSPKHNSVFRSKFDAYPGTGLDVFEDGIYTTINFEEPMQAWLYNVGIDFVVDENGAEYCVYGEYSHEMKLTRRIFRGKYPYSRRENWEIVYEFPSAPNDIDKISHIHHIIKDTYSKYMYCCCGDTEKESRWLYSDDLGKTWHLLIKNLPKGYLRCTNIIFTKSDIWWASDDTSHYLMHATRNTDGLVNIDSIKPICCLPLHQSTNGIAYIDNIKSLFFYDRTSKKISKIKYYIYNIKKRELLFIKELWRMKPTVSEWGNRGRCYNHYPNTSEPLLGMGFIEEYQPCIFHLIGNDGSTFGSIFYRIK